MSSWLPGNILPEGAGVDNKWLQDTIIQDIVKEPLRQSERAKLAALLAIMVAAEEVETETSYEYYDEDEDAEEYADEDEDDYEEGEDEEDDEVEEEEEEEEEDNDDDDDDIDDDIDECTSNPWGDLQILVEDWVSTENDEPIPVSRKRSLPHDETPRGQSVKRQRIDAPSVSKPQLHKDVCLPSEWESMLETKPHNWQCHAQLRKLLQGLALFNIHPAAQSFLLELDFRAICAEGMAIAAIDMGVRFLKTATISEYNIVFRHMLQRSHDAVAYNSCGHSDKHRHILFWQVVKAVTGKPIPPEPIKIARDERLQHEIEDMEEWRASQAEARKAAPHQATASLRYTYRTLREGFVKEVGEATKLPLNEKVHKWLTEIIPTESK
ncbi:hypothetical protein F66182_4269 [Fusarium sp. NRRL 66182]|nr:hypothetical protein F66182_4269 [Fusarium sp. NRRL 66182]